MKTKIKVIIITAIVSILLSIGFILLPDKQEKMITDSSVTTTQIITEVSTTTQTTTTATTEKKKVVKKTVKKKPQDKEAYKAYAHQLIIENGWSENDYNDLVKL